MTPSRFEAWLRTPRGVLALLGSCLAAAVVLALLLGSQRAFFEARVRETYAPPTADAVALALTLAGGAREHDLSPRQVDEVYQAWMQVGDGWPVDAPRALVRASPAFLERAAQTLVAGSLSQRRAAARFLAATKDARAVPILARAAQRASRRREDALAREIEEAVRSLTGGSSRVWGPRA